MKLSLLSSREVCKFLEKIGLQAIRQKGSHKLKIHSDERTTVVPVYSNKQVSRGLLRGILKEISMERDKFFKNLT